MGDVLSTLRRRLPFLHIEPRELDITCPVCGNTGSPYYPHPYKVWELAGRDDEGHWLRRCRKCKAEIGIRYRWQWWLPREVWLHSVEPEYGKGKRRLRERRAARRKQAKQSSNRSSSQGA